MNLAIIVSGANLKGGIMSTKEKFLQISQHPKNELIGFGHDTTCHPGKPTEA